MVLPRIVFHIRFAVYARALDIHANAWMSGAGEYYGDLSRRREVPVSLSQVVA